jgi:hypothetical protein
VGHFPSQHGEPEKPHAPPAPPVDVGHPPAPLVPPVDVLLMHTPSTQRNVASHVFEAQHVDAKCPHVPPAPPVLEEPPELAPPASAPPVLEEPPELAPPLVLEEPPELAPPELAPPAPASGSRAFDVKESDEQATRRNTLTSEGRFMGPRFLCWFRLFCVPL